MLQEFDSANTFESCDFRKNTVTPSQSLDLLNNDLVLEWAQAFAGRVLNDSGLTPEAQVERAFKLAYGRAPSAEEQKIASDFLDDGKCPIMRSGCASGDKSKPPLPIELPAGIRSGASRRDGRSVANADGFERVSVHQLRENAMADRMLNKLKHHWNVSSRREFFTQAGSGLAGIALAAMLAEDGYAAAARSARAQALRISLRKRQEHHLVFHGRRSQPGGSVRSQAVAGKAGASARAAFVSSRDAAHRARREAQRRSVPRPARVQAIRPERPLGLGLASQHRRARRRYRGASGPAHPTP